MNSPSENSNVSREQSGQIFQQDLLAIGNIIHPTRNLLLDVAQRMNELINEQMSMVYSINRAADNLTKIAYGDLNSVSVLGTSTISIHDSSPSILDNENKSLDNKPKDDDIEQKRNAPNLTSDVASTSIFASSPIVYSINSDDDSDFEQSVAQQTTNSSIIQEMKAKKALNKSFRIFKSKSSISNDNSTTQESKPKPSSSKMKGFFGKFKKNKK